MIYNNGYVRFLYSDEIKFDEYGVPMKVDEQFGEPVRCMFLAVTDDKMGNVSDANFIRRMYKVHIKREDIGNPIRCELSSENGNILLNGTVQSISYGKLIDRIEITIGK